MTQPARKLTRWEATWVGVKLAGLVVAVILALPVGIALVVGWVLLVGQITTDPVPYLAVFWGVPFLVFFLVVNRTR